MDNRLPSEILRDKYVPIKDFEGLYGIPKSVIEELIKSRRIRYAELKKPGEYRRVPSVNPEDVAEALGVELTLVELS